MWHGGTTRACVFENEENIIKTLFSTRNKMVVISNFEIIKDDDVLVIYRAYVYCKDTLDVPIFHRE